MSREFWIGLVNGLILVGLFYAFVATIWWLLR
jgi:hypothetical protein